MSADEMLLRLVMAVLAGGLVGLERERQDRPAGLRTHTYVCAGSALVTLVSIEMAGGKADPTRVAAQIVSGVGFLGAGTIFRSGNAVRGLTTAAGIWVVSGIGMAMAAAGWKLILMGWLTALLMIGANWWIRSLENRVFRSYQELTLRAASLWQEPMTAVITGLADRGVKVRRVNWLSEDGDNRSVLIQLRLNLPAAMDVNSLTAWLAAVPGIHSVEWD